MLGQNKLKRAAIERHLKEHPELTDLAIAELVEVDIGGGHGNVSHNTVAVVRKELEEAGIIPHTTERFELNGRRARGRKPRE